MQLVTNFSKSTNIEQKTQNPDVGPTIRPYTLQNNASDEMTTT